MAIIGTPPGKLGKSDLKRFPLESGWKVIGAVALTGAISALADVDFGEWQTVVSGAFFIALDFLQRYLSDTRVERG